MPKEDLTTKTAASIEAPPPSSSLGKRKRKRSKNKAPGPAKKSKGVKPKKFKMHEIKDFIPLVEQVHPLNGLVYRFD